MFETILVPESFLWVTFTHTFLHPAVVQRSAHVRLCRTCLGEPGEDQVEKSGRTQRQTDKLYTELKLENVYLQCKKKSYLTEYYLFI